VMVSFCLPRGKYSAQQKFPYRLEIRNPTQFETAQVAISSSLTRSMLEPSKTRMPKTERGILVLPGPSKIL
jgi:hypothetical protein